MGVDILYGAFVFVSTWISGGCANAIPNLQVKCLDGIVWVIIEDVPNGGKSIAFAEGLQDAKVCVLFDKRNCACTSTRKVDICFVDYDYASEFLVL